MKKEKYSFKLLQVHKSKKSAIKSCQMANFIRDQV